MELGSEARSSESYIGRPSCYCCCFNSTVSFHEMDKSKGSVLAISSIYKVVRSTFLDHSSEMQLKSKVWNLRRRRKQSKMRRRRRERIRRERGRRKKEEEKEWLTFIDCSHLPNCLPYELPTTVHELYIFFFTFILQMNRERGR